MSSTEQSAQQTSSIHAHNMMQPSHLDGILNDTLTPTEISDRYTFIEKLGSGTQGNVYKACRHSDQKIVAIKKLRIDSVNTWKEYDLFHREADVLSSINEHGIAEFYEAIECLNAAQPSAYIVQELIEGRSLQRMLKTGFRFTISRIFRMAYNLINLLEKLHTHNPPIIHRDIKPNNIIMRPTTDSDEFEPYLIDFGAVANPTVQKGGSTVAGTYGYMPPEQLVGRPCPASDIYSLGATIVYMLCGVEPADMRVADFRLIIDPYLEQVPRPIVTVLHQILDPKPETRLADYNKLRDIFDRFSHDDYNIDNTQDAIDPEKLNQRLIDVNAFNQPGNVDLWMMLPEKTPREVPSTLPNIIMNTDIDKQIHAHGATLKIISAILLVVMACMGGVIYHYSTLTHATQSERASSVVFIIFVGIILLAVVCIFFGQLKQRSNLKQRKSQTYTLFNRIQRESDLKMYCGFDHKEDIPMLMLLRFGRKAIATIVDFVDLPIPSNQREIHRISKYIVSTSRVPFRLRYRFNPPDDASADDLIHQITIYNHQTEGLEPGTPISILYYIDPKDNSNVYSMPYPFPFKEIVNTQETIINKENLCGHTIGVF